MSSLLPTLSLLTLTIKPGKFRIKQEEKVERVYHDVPGRSQNDRSATSGPLICNETQLVEKLNSEIRSSSSLFKKSFDDLLGFKIAFCA